MTGGETARQILETAFPAYAGRGMREAHGLMRKSVADDHTVLSDGERSDDSGGSCIFRASFR
jgi:hypothetical protein